MRIDGTRITMHRIAVLYKQGQNAEEIARNYPHLSLSQVYTACRSTASASASLALWYAVPNQDRSSDFESRQEDNR